MEEWSAIWSGRITDNSKGSLYWYQVVRPYDHAIQDLEEKAVLIGYNYDGGVLANQGRVGAKAGPDEIRKMLAKCAIETGVEKLFDRGNIIPRNSEVHEAQETLAFTIHEILQKQGIPIVLGGGHDLSYGTFLGLTRHLGERKKIGVINFDAHFDLREPANGVNSGTPFYQAFLTNSELAYLAIGIQQESNTRDLFDFAANHNVEVISDLEANSNEAVNKIGDLLEHLDYIHLSIDMDVFPAAFAPGVSAINPLGIMPAQVLRLLEPILESGKVMAIDIAETNPVFDIDGWTAKLAARIISRIIHRLH